MGKLSGKVALITGGSSGIGRATCILFAREGARVVVADIVEEGSEKTVSTIREAGGEAIFVRADVSRAADVENMVNKTISTYGKLDILFNCAGIEQATTAPTHTLTEEVWDKVIDVNLKGVFLGMKYGIPHMLDRGGAIISMSSMAGLVGLGGLSAYCASKGGVLQLTKAAAVEYAKRKVRINCICAGYIDTPLIQRSRSGSFWDTEKPYRVPSPIERMGTAEEVAHTALFLASDEVSFITGTGLVIDGGVTAL